MDPVMLQSICAPLSRTRSQARPHPDPYAKETPSGALRSDRAEGMGYASHIQRRTCRAAGLPQRLNRYKGRRPHGSLKSNTPSKLGLTEVRLLT